MGDNNAYHRIALVPEYVVIPGSYVKIYFFADTKQPVSGSVTTRDLRLALLYLFSYTNYSIEVRAYTIKGDGLAAGPVFCQTHEDGKKREIERCPIF